ncbi:hypothetical protein P152DRAFT_405038, partial [Eremomyces bilateralis CBS 781.70]
AAMIDERELQIHPIVQDSMQHNTKTIDNIRALTSSLFGVGAGALGLSSYAGFLFYLVGSLIVSTLIFVLRAEGPKGGADKYFYNIWTGLWLGDLMGGLMGFVLTWTLVYGLVVA